MNDRLRTVLVPTLAAACAVAMTASASAAEKNTHSELRVEAIGKTLEAGTNYSNASIGARNGNACGPTDSRRERLRGANAMGLVGNAARVNRRLTPFRTSDTFDFGLIVCQVGDSKGFANRAWLYRVNHRSPTIGADKRKVDRGDEVLWYFANFSTGQNTGQELDLRDVPVRVRPGQSFQVGVVGYDEGGSPSPAFGAQVRGGAAPPTNAAGRTTVMARATPGTMRLRAVRGDDIVSAPVEVCVANDLSRCPDARGETFVGTGDADGIRGTGGPDSIRPRGGRDAVTARGGSDSVFVRGGGRDRVNCGPGRDRVRADREDRVGDTCEAVERGR